MSLLWERLVSLPRRFRRSSSPSPQPNPERQPDPPPVLTDQDHQKLKLLLSLVNEASQPNMNALNETLRNVDILALNVKALGYDLARRLGTDLQNKPAAPARSVVLASKISTQEDIESDWFRHWCSELMVPVVCHRKLWEFAYVLQALHDRGHLDRPGRGLGFGCGIEPLPSYLAKRGIHVTMTDLPPEDVRVKGWTINNEYASTPEHARAAHLVDSDTFARHVQHRHVDMNAIPDDLLDYDFCWSICALEHLGSIRQGLAFIEASLRTLKPGGTAIHTLEFNVNAEGHTIDNWMTVLFQRKHIEQIAETLSARGHQVARLDFDLGAKPLDQFVDLPPWHDWTRTMFNSWLGQPHHLKVAVDGFVVTCFGLAITKAA